MSYYTQRPFAPQDHDPLPFLGQRVVLSELEHWEPKFRAFLENPLLSKQAMIAWAECMPAPIMNYDQFLKPAHWGVICARTLEAMFWRLADMADETQAFTGACPVDTQEIQLFLESASDIQLSRDLQISFRGASPNAHANSFEYPYVAGDFALPNYAANSRVRGFWEPLQLGMITQAMAAFDALRFPMGNRARARRFTINLASLRTQGLAPCWGELFGPLAQAGLCALAMEEGPALLRAPANRL